MTNAPAEPASRLPTADDLLTLPDDGTRHALVDGVSLVHPPPGLRRGRVQLALASLLRPHVKAEVISPSDTPYEVEDEVAQYLAAGTRLAWVIDPRRRTVAIHTLGAPVLGDDDTLDAGDVVPGFRRAVREFME